jgi:hypothetical protein
VLFFGTLAPYEYRNRRCVDRFSVIPRSSFVQSKKSRKAFNRCAKDAQFAEKKNVTRQQLAGDLVGTKKKEWPRSSPGPLRCRSINDLNPSSPSRRQWLYVCWSRKLQLS